MPRTIAVLEIGHAHEHVTGLGVANFGHDRDEARRYTKLELVSPLRVRCRVRQVDVLNPRNDCVSDA